MGIFHHSNNRKHGGQEGSSGRKGGRTRGSSPRTDDEQALAVFTPPQEHLGAREDGEEDDELSRDNISIFNTKKPAHIGTGLVNCVGNMAKGVGLGVGTLVAAPVVGSYQSGVSGFAKGCVAGVAAALVLPLAGAATGMYQVYEGTKNTPAYFHETNQGKIYDEKAERWVDKYRNLDDVYKEAEEDYKKYQEIRARQQQKRQHSPTAAAAATFDGKVVDTEYYDTLGVPPDAGAAEIRKAYYKLARDCHPDKNKDDPEAKVKFQKVGQAYQVLGDETRRAEYDKYGTVATQSMTFIDPGIFFSVLLGSEKLEPYVGKLKLTALFDMADNEGKLNSGHMKLDKREQDYREASLAVQMRAKLEPAVNFLINDDEEGTAKWKRETRLLADELCAASFGAPLLKAVGFAYQNYGGQFIASKESSLGMGRLQKKTELKMRQWTVTWNIVHSAARASMAAKAMKNLETDNESSTAADMNSQEALKMENSLKHILDVLLQLCVHDILSTVRSACKKFVTDKSVSEDVQLHRAQALVECGKLFQIAADDYMVKHTSVNARMQMEEAFIKMAQKLDTQQQTNSDA